MERFGISVAGQTWELVWFAAVGAILGVWYELFRIGRLLAPPSARRVFAEDVAAAVGAAFITQAAALPISSGRVRLLHLLSLLCGATVYYVTVGRLIHGCLRRVVRVIATVCCKLKSVLSRKWEKCKSFCKKAGKSFKKPLQHEGEM